MSKKSQSRNWWELENPLENLQLENPLAHLQFPQGPVTRAAHVPMGQPARRAEPTQP
jgi:hypothetical protein